MPGRKTPDKNLQRLLSSKKLLFAPWGAENRLYCGSYQQWYRPLKNLFGSNMIVFDPQICAYRYGTIKMNRRFIEVIRREKPDFIFLWYVYGQFFPETMFKMRALCPDTKIITFFWDDDTAFESLSRYYAHFFDYCLVGEIDYIPMYKREGITQVIPAVGVSRETFRPLNLNKKYDVTFIGAPKANRYEFIRYLKDRGVNISLFGGGWDKHQDLARIYKGALQTEKMIEILNQTKINLCFTRNYLGESHMNPRVLEAGATKVFSLVEYSPILSKFFKQGMEIVMFNGKEDLLKKIRYYLKNEKERDTIAKAAYNKVMAKYTAEIEFEQLFKRAQKEKKVQPPVFPRVNKRVLYLSSKDMDLSEIQLQEKLKNTDYICFKKGRRSISRYKDLFQIYSLEVTGKPISCCDYYISRAGLGDYLGVRMDLAFLSLSKSDFSKILDINQLMVEKKYLLENLPLFKSAYFSNRIGFINEKNTVPVSIPMVKLSTLKCLDLGDNKKNRAATLGYLMVSLRSLLHKSKISAASYLSKLIFCSILTKNYFVVKHFYHLLLKTLRKRTDF